MIMRVRRQSQMHRQSHIPFVQYLPVFFSCVTKPGVCVG